MAIPVLYWMLECTDCGARLVVHDCYLVLVGGRDPAADSDTGYEGPPLPQRHRCVHGCDRPMRAVGSMFSPDDRTMWLHDPHVPITMTKTQSREWRRLLQEPGYAGNPAVAFVPTKEPWWEL
jgi:hypothetical protein